LLMLGTPFTAQRAYELGLVNAVVPQEQLLPAAVAAAERLASLPTGSMLVTKRLLKARYERELDRVMDEEVQALRERLTSPEVKEALTAFLEKRKPDFSKFR